MFWNVFSPKVGFGISWPTNGDVFDELLVFKPVPNGELICIWAEGGFMPVY